MQFGAPAPRQRPQLITLNLIPPEFRRRVLPWLTIGLALVLISGLALAYGSLYAKTYGDWEVAKLQTRVAQGQDAVRTASADQSAASRDQQRTQSIQNDYRALTERQILWSEVMSSVFSAPGGVNIDGVTQAGYTLTVTGSAPDYDTAVAYLSALRATNYFLDLSIQVVGEQGPPAPLTPGPGPGTSASATPPPQATRPPSPVPVAATPTRVAAIPPARTSAPAVVPPAATPSPAATATPSPAPTTVRSPIPTPAFDYSVGAVNRTQRTGGASDVAYLRGRILDLDGTPMLGLRVRVKTTDGGWQADSPATTSGRPFFEFPVSRGSYNLQILDVRSEVAGNLVTGVTGSSSLTDFDVTFKKVPPVQAQPAVTDNGTPGVTATPSNTVTPQPTSVAPGSNIASQASVSVSGNPDDARLAVDGDVNTVWNAKTYPVASIELDFSNFRQVEGVEFVVSQVPAGSTTHELWVYDDSNTWVLERTFTSTTDDGSVIGYRFSPIRNILKIFVRTLRSPSFVAWREIRVFEAVAPPGGFPTSTPGPSATATSPATATSTSTPTVTVTGTPPTGTPTVTLTPGPTSNLDLIQVNAANMYSNPASGPSSGCAAGLGCLVDGNLSTVWYPPNAGASAVWIYMPLDGANYSSASDSLARVDIVPALGTPPPTPSSLPWRMEVWTQAVGQAPVFQCSFASASAAQNFTCIPAASIASAQWVLIGLSPPVDTTGGIAEIRPYKVRRPFIVTPSATPTATPTSLTGALDKVPYPQSGVTATSSQTGFGPGLIADGVTTGTTGWFPASGSTVTQYVTAPLDTAGVYSSTSDSVGAIQLYPAMKGSPPSTVNYIVFAVPSVVPTGTPTPYEVCQITVAPSSAGTAIPCPIGTPLPNVRQLIVGIPPRADTGTIDGSVGVAELAVYKVRQPVVGAVGRGPGAAPGDSPTPARVPVGAATPFAAPALPVSTPPRAAVAGVAPPPATTPRPGQRLSFVILMDVRSGVGYR